MVRDVTSCDSCGARIPDMSNKCPKCGKRRARREVRKHYSGVLQQQGRVKTDDDWNENTRLSGKVGKLAVTRCASCGATNNRKNTKCRNCGANL